MACLLMAWLQGWIYDSGLAGQSSPGTFAGIVGKETLSLSEKAGTEEQVSLELSMPALPTQGEN